MRINPLPSLLANFCVPENKKVYLKSQTMFLGLFEWLRGKVIQVRIFSFS